MRRKLLFLVIVVFLAGLAAWLAVQGPRPVPKSAPLPSWNVAVEVELPPPPPPPPPPPTPLPDIVPAPVPPAESLTLSEPVLPGEGQPVRVAIIIDDMGMKDEQDVFKTLPPEVTLSYLAYAPNLPGQTREAMALGHEVMLHLPMEPEGNNDPGPGALMTTLSPEENTARLLKALGSFEGYVGINNHMGSKFSKYKEGMELVAQTLRERGLFFVDSRTDSNSIAGEVVKQAGVRVAWRDVFLDDDDNPKAIRAQLSQVEKIARSKGKALAIGHPRPATLAVLGRWLSEALGKGIQIVPVSEIVE